jgi:hypothetical protein
VVAAGSLWGSGLPRVWGFGRNALVAGWATGRLTGWRLGGIVAEWGSGGLLPTWGSVRTNGEGSDPAYRRSTPKGRLALPWADLNGRLPSNGCPVRGALGGARRKTRPARATQDAACWW